MTNDLVVTPVQANMEASSATVEGAMLRWNNPGPAPEHPGQLDYLLRKLPPKCDFARPANLGPTGTGGFSTVGYSLPIEDLIRTGPFVTFQTSHLEHGSN